MQQDVFAIEVRRVSRFLTPPPAPVDPPTGITGSPSPTAIEWNWTPSVTPGVLGYNIARRVGGTVTPMGSTTASSTVFTGLEPETAYTLLVSAFTADNESPQVTASATTTALPTPKSTISFLQVDQSVVEGTTRSITLRRQGGDNTAAETVDIGLNTNAQGADYSITWPGGVANEATFGANVTEVSIQVLLNTDSETEVGESATFTISPSATDAYLVSSTNNASILRFVDAPSDTYGDSTITFTGLEGSNHTVVRTVLSIPPTPPGALPVFELVGATTTYVPDVWPLLYDADGNCDRIIVEGRVDHDTLTATTRYDQTVTLRHTPTATKLGAAQYDTTDFTALRLTVRGLPTHGDLVVDPFTTTEATRAGDWGHQAVYFGYCEPPARNERFGVTTQVTISADGDLAIVDMMPRADLYNVNDGAGHYAQHPEVSGDVYFEAMEITSIPAGWVMEHYHNNTGTMDGNFIVVDEGGLQPLPCKSRMNIRRFYLRRTATCSQQRARSKFTGAGLGQVTAGEFAVDKFFGGTINGAPVGQHSDRAAQRLTFQEEELYLLNGIENDQFGAEGGTIPDLWVGPRVGWYHCAGTFYYTLGGGYYLHAAAGYSNEVSELNILRTMYNHSTGRTCTGLVDYDDGSIVTNKTIADTNGGQTIHVQDPNGAKNQSWFRHMRPDSDTVHGAGATNPNLILQPNENDLGWSLMPVANPWSIPGGGATVISADYMWPMRLTTAAFGTSVGDPPQGKHHRRLSHMLDGLLNMTGDLLYVRMAQEEASHVMHTFPYYPIHPSGNHADLRYFELEYALEDAIADIADHPNGRPHWGGGGGGEFFHQATVNPAYVQRLIGEIGTMANIGMAVTPAGALRDEMVNWGNKMATLIDLRLTPNGWGFRDWLPGDFVRSAHLASQFGDTQLASQQGGWPNEFVGGQAHIHHWVSDFVAGMERRFRPRASFPSGQIAPHLRACIDAWREHFGRARNRGRKVPSAYFIVASQQEAVTPVDDRTGNVGDIRDPYDHQPAGSLNGVGSGLTVPDWTEGHRRDSAGGPLSDAVQTTLRDYTVHWAVAVANALDLHPEITDLPILDHIRTMLEGIREEDDGRHHTMTYAEAAEVCMSGFTPYGGVSGEGTKFYPANFFRHRRIPAIGLMQNASYWLEKYPHWGTGDPTGVVEKPEGFTVQDTAEGLVMTWQPRAGAQAYLIEWFERWPTNGIIDGSFQAVGTTSHTVASLLDNVNYHVRISSVSSTGTVGTSTYPLVIRTGSGQTATEPGSGGGGGDRPGTPVIDNIVGIAGGLRVTYTDPQTGTVPFATYLEHSDDPNFTSFTEVYQYIADEVAPTYTLDITGLAQRARYVRLRTRDGNAAFSAYSNVEAGMPSPGTGGGGTGADIDAPTGFTTSPSAGRIDLDWANVTGAVYYFVGVGDNEDPEQGTWNWYGQDYSGPSIMTANLPADGVQTYLAIAGINAKGQRGPASNVRYVTMPDMTGDVEADPGTGTPINPGGGNQQDQGAPGAPAATGGVPTGLQVNPEGSGAGMSWNAMAEASGYEAGYGTRRDTITNTTFVPLAANPSHIVTNHGAGLVWYSVRSILPESAVSEFAEPYWVFSTSKFGVNPFKKPVIRPQGEAFDSTKGHVGPAIDDGSLVPASTLLTDAGNPLPREGGRYVFEQTGADAFTQWPVEGVWFDNPIRVDGDATYVAQFNDCRVDAGSPVGLPNAGNTEAAYPYAVEIDNAAGSTAQINMLRCWVRYGEKNVWHRGGSFIDCIFQSSAEDGMFVDYLFGPFVKQHCLVVDLGDRRTGYIATPHGDGLQLRGSWEWTLTNPHPVTITGCFYDTYASTDPDKPSYIDRCNSAIIGEAANTKIGDVSAPVVISYNWFGSGNNNLQMKDDTSTPKGDPDYITFHGNIVSVIANNVAIDVIVDHGEAYGNTLSNGDPADADFSISTPI